MASRAYHINLLAALIAVGGALAAATIGDRTSSVTVRAMTDSGLGTLEIAELDDGRRALPDAHGVLVPLQPYVRIASASTISDWLLMELCRPDHVLAVTTRSADGAPWRHRFAGKQTIESLSNIEALLSLKSDLLVVDSFGDPKRAARLRESGIAVFDMGQARGLDTLMVSVQRIGLLCARPARAEILALRLRTIATGIARHLSAEQRPRAMYISPYGDKLFGGTTGTGYHDILRFAGLRDAASEAFSNYPEYTAEHVLTLAPELVVTRRGMGNVLCRHPGLSSLHACTTPGAIVELEGFAFDDPGLGFIESIETLYRAVHGRRSNAVPARTP